VKTSDFFAKKQKQSRLDGKWRYHKYNRVLTTKEVNTYDSPKWNEDIMNAIVFA